MTSSPTASAPCSPTPRRFRRAIAGPLSATCARCSSAATRKFRSYRQTFAKKSCIRLRRKNRKHTARERPEEKRNEGGGLQSAREYRSHPPARAFRRRNRSSDLPHRHCQSSGALLPFVSSRLHFRSRPLPRL